jgi:hypothetical protein
MLFVCHTGDVPRWRLVQSSEAPTSEAAVVDQVRPVGKIPLMEDGLASVEGLAVLRAAQELDVSILASRSEFRVTEW